MSSPSGMDARSRRWRRGGDDHPHRRDGGRATRTRRRRCRPRIRCSRRESAGEGEAGGLDVAGQGSNLRRFLGRWLSGRGA